MTITIIIIFIKYMIFIFLIFFNLLELESQLTLPKYMQNPLESVALSKTSETPVFHFVYQTMDTWMRNVWLCFT